MKEIYLSCLLLFFVTCSYSQTRLDSKSIIIDSIDQKKLSITLKAYTIISFDSKKNKEPAWNFSESDRIQFSIAEADAVTIFNLEPHDVRDAVHRSVLTTVRGEIEEKRSPVKWFKGYLDNDINQPVRLTIDEHGVEGFFIQNNRMRFIEPLTNHIKQSPAYHFITYYADDVMDKNMICGATEMENYLKKSSRSIDAAAAATPANRQLKIATDADHSYYLQNKSATNDHILGIINQVEGLYEKDFGLTFKVTFQNAYQDDTDPYNSIHGLALLEQFQNHWNENRQNIPRDIAFLFNYELLESGTLGRAYQGQVCVSKNSSYGLFSNTSFLYESVIVAHEIGHLFGAVHESSAGCADSATIMCPSVGAGSFAFSQPAKNAISSHIDMHTCLDTSSEIKIYPIPAQKYLIIECMAPGFSFILYNTVGQEVHRSQHQGSIASIPTSDFSDGFYIATILGSDNVITKRVEIVK